MSTPHETPQQAASCGSGNLDEYTKLLQDENRNLRAQLAIANSNESPSTRLKMLEADNTILIRQKETLTQSLSRQKDVLKNLQGENTSLRTSNKSLQARLDDMLKQRETIPPLPGVAQPDELDASDEKENDNPVIVLSDSSSIEPLELLTSNATSTTQDAATLDMSEARTTAQSATLGTMAPTKKPSYKKPWTELEKLAVKRGFEEFGEENDKWRKIQKKYEVVLKHRTNIQIKDCYRTMVNRGEIDEES